MSLYKLSVWYAAAPDTEDPYQHLLTPAEVERYVRPECGFMRDMLMLGGEGVTKLTLEVDR